MKVLLVTPPMSDLNTPYPATAYLTGFLKSRGIDVWQADWSIGLADRLLTPTGLERLCEAKPRRRAQNFRHFVHEYDRYRETIETVTGFLRNPDPQLSERMATRGFLPEGPQLRKHYEEGDGASGEKKRAYDAFTDVDRARHLCALYLGDIAAAVRDLNPGFELNSYARDAAIERRFSKVLRFLARERDGLIGQLIEELTTEALARRPDLLAMTVPFSGNMIGALQIARIARNADPELRIAIGGGFPNCHLRELSDPRFFDLIDYVSLDDGEQPLLSILEHLDGNGSSDRLLRTFVREGGKVIYRSAADVHDVPFARWATPTYEGLPLERYLAIPQDATRAALIWSRRWNKLTLAHGCYWRKCTFCDVSLDYVGRYEPQKADRLADQIATIVAETGVTDFHWVDEAAPPSVLRSLSHTLLERGIEISWYGNIRFEKAFDGELAGLMAEAGCVMVTGGLEVASDRLLGLINKGVTVEQVARVARHFADTGIHVHAYLMYGFPTQTVQETVDSLEFVRQMFVNGCLHSGHWHRFMVTEHSPVGQRPDEFGIRLRPDSKPLFENRVYGRFEVPFKDPTHIEHDLLGPGLLRGLNAYMRGLEFDRPVHELFPLPVARTSIDPDFIATAIQPGPEY